MAIAKDTLIKIKDDVDIKLDDEKCMSVVCNDERIPLNKGIFDILNIFSDFFPMGDGLALLVKAFKDSEERARALDLFKLMLAKDFFEAADGGNVRVGQDNGPFRSLTIHIRMLNDVGRTEAYKQALEAVVGPDDVVLDIGTGSGVLAALAAKAGARRVYAVERSVMKEVAAGIFKDNGLDGSITAIRGDSKDIELPERATVLVSEIVGNDAFDEGMIETYTDALERHLVPGAQIIPSSLECYLLPVEFGAEMVDEIRVTDDAVRRWKDAYAIDFSGLKSARYDQTFYRRLADIKRTVHDFKILGAPAQSAFASFRGTPTLKKEDTVELTFDKGGTFNGIILYHVINLNDEIKIDGSPEVSDPTYSWNHPVYFLNQPIEVAAGDRLELSYDIKAGDSVLELKR